MDIQRLKAIMVLHDESVRDLADVIGLSPSSVYRKLDGVCGEFTQGEIAKIKAHYDLTAEQVDQIFFAKLVS